MIEHSHITSPMKERAAELLSQALITVYQDRQTQYGAAEDEFKRIGIIWGELLSIEPIEPRIVALMMILLKVCRENVKHKHDNLVDIIGYTLCLQRTLNANEE